MTEKIIKISADDFGELALENLTKGATIRFRAHGRSMLPTIHNEDVLTVTPLGQRGIKWGDIILYRTNAPNGLIAHRLIRKKLRGQNKVILARGDALGGEMECVKEESVLGRVTHVVHNGQTIRIDKPIARVKGQLWAIQQSLRHLYRTIIPRKSPKS